MPPPPLPASVKASSQLRLAKAANMFLPGAGLFLLGRRVQGAVLAGLFLAAFLAVLVLFLVGYANYFSAAVGDDLFKPGRLEEIGTGFHQAWLVAIAGVGAVIWAIAAILFSREKKRLGL